MSRQSHHYIPLHPMSRYTYCLQYASTESAAAYQFDIGIHIDSGTNTSVDFLTVFFFFLFSFIFPFEILKKKQILTNIFQKFLCAAYLY